MTDLTPQQMRELADEPMMYNEVGVKFRSRSGKPIDELRTALRAAADQLEAVRRLADLHVSVARQRRDSAAEFGWVDVLAILPADTAPQEDRDE